MLQNEVNQVKIVMGRTFPSTHNVLGVPHNINYKECGHVGYYTYRGV